MESFDKILGVGLILLTLLSGGLFAQYLWSQQQFVRAAPSGLEGYLRIPDLTTPYEFDAKAFPHTPATPFLYNPFGQQDAFWSSWARVENLEGIPLPSLEFAHGEAFFGEIYQDVCFDSLQLTYYSCFEDSIKVKVATKPAGMLNRPVKRLDKLANYHRQKIPKDQEWNSIYLVMESQGCFSFSQDIISIQRAGNNNLLRFKEEYGADTSFVIASAVGQELFDAIIASQNKRGEDESTTTFTAKIKVDHLICEIQSFENDLTAIHDILKKVRGTIRPS